MEHGRISTFMATSSWYGVDDEGDVVMEEEEEEEENIMICGLR